MSGVVSVLFYTGGCECWGIDCKDGDNVVIMMLRMKSVARFSSRCAVSSGLCWGFQCKAGQGGGGSLN